MPEPEIFEEAIPPAPMTMPASPFAREMEDIVERVFARVIERVEASNNGVKDALRDMLSEMFEMKREIEHLKIRVSAHDTQIAALVVATVKPLVKNATPTKKRRRK